LSSLLIFMQILQFDNEMRAHTHTGVHCIPEPRPHKILFANLYAYVCFAVFYMQQHWVLLIKDLYFYGPANAM